MVGRTINNAYTISAIIAKGDVATVCKAEIPAFEQTVVLKLIHPEIIQQQPEYANYFLETAKTCSRVQHPGISRVLEAGWDNGQLYAVFNYYDGQTLRERIRQQAQLDFPEAAALLHKLATALDYLHSNGFLHGNLSSDNIMLEKETGGNPMLLDFGFLKPAMPLTGDYLRHKDYLAPEQAAGQPVSYSTEIYHFGLLAYEMLTGRTPLSDVPPEQKLERLAGAPTPPGQFRQGIPQAMVQTVMKCLARDPSFRFPSAGEFALQFYKAAPQPARPTASPPVQQFPQETGQAMPPAAAPAPDQAQLRGRFCENHEHNMAVAYCISCGKALCPECEKLVDGKPWCQECLNADKREKIKDTVEKIKPSQETVDRVRTVVASRSQNKELRRLAALGIDLVVVLLGGILAMLPVWAASIPLMPEVHGLSMGISYYIGLLLFSAVYYIVAHYKWGRTLGKQWMGLEVVRTDGKPLTLAGAFWRWVGFQTAVIWAMVGWWIALRVTTTLSAFNNATGKVPAGVYIGTFAGMLLLGLVLSLGLLITLVGKHKRGFHDILGGSMVQYQQWLEGRIRSESEPQKISGPDNR